MKKKYISLIVLAVIAGTISYFNATKGAAEVTTDNGNRTVTFTYTATKEKVDATLEDAAHWLYSYKHKYPVEGKDFEDLTNQEKLDVLDQGVKDIIIHYASSYTQNVAAEQAAAAATASSSSGYDL